MSDKNDGGPAFPFWNPGTSLDGQQTGMSLRDWFAGQALALLAHSEENGNPDWIVSQAYRIAGAMLKERGK